MAKKANLSYNDIRNLNEDWQLDERNGLPYSGESVQKFIKKHLGRASYFRWSTAIDAQNFYHLWGFASKEDADTYIENPEEHADLLLVDEPLPISTVQGDSFGAYLFTTMAQNADIVVSKADLDIELRFHAVRISNGERLNMGSKGTLTFQRSLDGGRTWTSAGVIEGAINSTDYTNTTTYTTLNIGQYLQKGYRQLIRVRGSFTYTDDTGTDKVATSTWVQVGSSITYTELSVECLQGWHTPLFAANIKSVGFPVSYRVNGAVNKILHILIQGANGTFDILTDADGNPYVRTSAEGMLAVNYELDSTENGVVFNRDISDASNTYKIFNHGVHAVVAWMTCDDGMGGTLMSDIMVNRFMVIDPETTTTPTKPYLMLQNVVSRLTNYVQTKICDYAVFNPNVAADGTITPSSDEVDVTFYMTSYSAKFPDDANVVEYFTSESKVEPSIQHSLTTTVELESDTAGDIQSYFRVWRKDADGKMVNFMQESMGVSNINIVVDNSDSFAPTLGASFVLNPKVRNNTEANPRRILNAQANNAEIESTWDGFDFINDGWVMTDDGVKVLRVLAGQKLNFKYNPFAQFLTTPDSAMTLDIDLCVRNVTNESDPILSVCEEITAGITKNLRGLQIKPMVGNMFTKTNTIDSETNFRFREEKRTHISINIHNAVVPSIGGDGLYDPSRFTPPTSIALVRVFIDGNIEREMKFPVSNADEFCTAAMSNGGFTIGQDGADIDIYSIRCYQNRQLDAQAVVKNYIATLPTVEEKLKVRAENNIMTGGRVDVEKVKALGKRVLILHGAEPYFYNTSVASVYWEIFQYDDEGNYIPELSGTICKQTGMKPKRQGSTANTYYYSNIQTKVDDGGEITIPLTMIHSSITVSAPYTNDDGKLVVGIYGGNLGKSDPVANEPKEYEYADGMVTLPDGWIDGNGMYRGKGFAIAENTPLAMKLVLKINYASSMQSHLCAGTRLYNDLHTAVVGKNSLQEAVPTARVSKYTEPVFFFTQLDDNSDIVFRGGGNFGGGKMDKPTWGYVKSKHPMFTMIEGSDNNYPLTDMRVPFTTDPKCPEYVSYSAADEGYFYNGLQCLDFDAGKTDDDDVPVVALRDRIAEIFNFIYMHSPKIEFFVGTFEQFKLSDEAKNTNLKYWCTDGEEAYKLKRYNFVSNEWVDAGLWNASDKKMSVIDLRTHEYTVNTYNSSEHKADYDLLNKELIGAIVAHAKKYVGWYINVKSLQFHYAFQNHFMAGTDNCSKNTYYVLDPKAKSVTIDGVTKQCYLLELHQDDVDTICLTDNNGRSTKPYYIDRMHPYDDADVAKTTSCYEGMYNVLFNLTEAMYEETRELQSMLNKIFTAMVGLVTSADNAKGYTNSIWGCLEKYMFSIQKFYPAMAFNEQARIRYEYPAMLGFVSQGSGARSIAPITQSMGSQLNAETQFMIRRVIYMASYAAWGNFYDAGKTYNIGIADAADSFSLQAFHLPNETTSNNNYSFRVRPLQYIYPTGMLGQTSIDPHVRVAPDEEYLLNLGNTESNDTGMSLLGINYYKSIGNVGDLSVSPNVTFEVKGKRLVEFIAEPTRTYNDESTQKVVGAFRPNQLNISAVQVKRVSLKGSGISGTIDVSPLTRLTSLDLRDTYIYDVNLPASEILTELQYPSTLTKLYVANLPNLETLTLQGTGSLQSVTLLQKQGVDSYSLMERCLDDNAPLSSVKIYDVNWENAAVGVMSYMADMERDKCTLTGVVNIYEPNQYQNAVTFDIKQKFIDTWGAIDDAENPLYITYYGRVTTGLNVTGETYLRQVGTYQWAARPTNQYSNDVTAIKWAITDNSFGITIDENTGLITAPKISSVPAFATVTITYYRKNAEPLVVERQVGLYDRPATVGDFVFCDGTYSDIYDGVKPVIGICFYVNPDDNTDRRMVALANQTTHQWGLRSDVIKNVKLTDSPSYECYDTPVINIGGVNVSANDANMRDENTGDKDGFKIYEANNCLGDIGLVELKSDIGQYKAGQKISVGMYKTLQIIAHRDKILGDSGVNLPIPTATDTKTEMQDLVDCINEIVANNSNNGNYCEYYFPAASFCHAYEPSVTKEGFSLADKFKRHNWYLPTSAELARMYWYHSKGYTEGVDYAVFAKAQKAGILTSFSASYYWSSTEYGAAGAWGVNFSNGYVYYNGKYNSIVIRAVAAF